MADAAGLDVVLRQAGPIPLDVALSCGHGELTALVGPSGSGKSTVLRAIAGLYRTAEGRITCDGEAWLDVAAGIDRPAHARRVGMVFQNYALFPHMSALGNVVAAMAHRPSGERRTEALRLLATVGLEGLEKRRPAQLSGGQQQRVAVARALAREPKVLLLDEPFSAVDRRMRRELQHELRELRRSVRVPIILVTHDLGEAADLSDKLVVLDRGDVLQSGPPREVIAHPAGPRVAAALDLETIPAVVPRAAVSGA